MTTQEIAQKLCDHCRNHTEARGLEELYADDARSVEPMAYGDQSPVSEGHGAIKAKQDWWTGAMEVHSVQTDGPSFHGDTFALIFERDCTEKASGNRWQSKEVGLYEVADGKIVKESFFMTPMG